MGEPVESVSGDLWPKTSVVMVVSIRSSMGFARLIRKGRGSCHGSVRSRGIRGRVGHGEDPRNRSLSAGQGASRSGGLRGEGRGRAGRRGRRRRGEDVVVVELKAGFSLTLAATGGGAPEDHRHGLCRGAALGRARRAGGRSRATSICASGWGLGCSRCGWTTGSVEVHADPGPFRPRKSKVAPRAAAGRVRPPRGRSEPRRHARQGGDRLSAGRGADSPPIWPRRGRARGRWWRRPPGVARATRMMADNHYGWFERVETGVYRLTPAGRAQVAAGAEGPPAPPRAAARPGSSPPRPGDQPGIF